MTFLNPILFAAGIAAVSIPIIIHLLMRRRRKPVMWGAMRFLLEAYREHRRRLRLEQFLLLAARCLLIALLAFALGRPLLGAAGLVGRGPVSVYLLVDNGLASSAVGSERRGAEVGGTALSRHQAVAASLLSQLDAVGGDRAALITLGGPAEAVVLPPSTDTGGLRELVNNLQPTDSITDLPGALSLVRDHLDADVARRGGRTVIVVLSEFLTGSADAQRKLAELGRREGVTLLASRPTGEGASNVGITALEPLRPVVIAPRRDQAAARSSVSVALRRSGPGVGEAAAGTVRLWLETDARAGTRIPVGQAPFRWSPGQTVLTTAAPADLSGLPANSTSVVLIATIDADAIAGDNTFRRPIEVRQALRVGIIAPRAGGVGRTGIQQFRPADWFRLALAPGEGRDAEIEPVEIEPANLDQTRLAGLDAAIITRPDSLSDDAWRRLRAFADAGGLVVITPPSDATVHLWADSMSRELGVPWTMAREARDLDGATLSPERDTSAGRADLLNLLASELPDLVTPVQVFRILPMETPAAQRGAQLLKLADGSPVIVAARPGTREQGDDDRREARSEGRGLVVLFTVAPSFDWTDLQAKPLMVPLAQELVRQGVGRARGSSSTLAGLIPELPARTDELRAAGEGTGIIAISGGRADRPIRSAGLWRALDDRGVSRGMVAINADPAAGLGDAQPDAAIGAWLSSAIGGGEVAWLEGPQSLGGESVALTTILERQSSRSSALVLPLLMAAMLIGMLELAMGRWFSHAIVTPREGAAA